MIKPERTRGAGHVASMEDNIYFFFTVKPLGRKSFRMHFHRFKDNIKMNLK